ncbi:GGDEF domain-containing response regulator [Oceanisphaera pacifica]|uniref:diguanylate cyclase n=1 Tax=Oceanisphaera pacifica TaxID=2818389 RepID=A0ABS3NIX4_9GAMM|nr:diguanylate cyclase [Oceanisphaera pacifica]MBO1520522.1 diguanylate cyclase [Oceanisphaera pacifica]
MAPETTAIENRLLLLKIRFAEKTTTQLTALLAALASKQGARVTATEVEDLYQLLHRLSGSAGTFGYHQLGQQAMLLADTIKPTTHATTPTTTPIVDADFLYSLQQLLLLLQQNDTPSAPEVTHPQAAIKNKTQILIIGQELSQLVTALTPYGFTINHCEQPITNCNQCWHYADIIIAPAHQLTTTVAWNNTQAQQHQQQAADILCIGTQDTFSARYALASKGAKGLFTLPVDIAKLAERIEQIGQERRTAYTSKILLLDDDQELAEHYRLVLTAAGKDVKVMHSPEHLLTVLSEFSPDIVLLDVHIPPYSGITLARMIRFEPKWLSLPIVYLSSEQDRDQQIMALAQGADDFITKPISDQQLVNSVHALCYRARTLAKLLSCDSLTGLLNHSHIKQALDHEYARIQRYGHSTTIAILDLDHFKQVNDQHGHAAGDLVIKAFAHLLKQRLRYTDHIGRYGGEEFVAVLPNCDLTQAQPMFNAVCRHFSRLSFHGRKGEFNVTVSIGLAQLNHFPLAEHALKAADQALYQRKHQGRNGVTCFTPKDAN